MPILKNTQTRLSIRSGSTTLTLDRTSGKMKAVENPLSQVVSVSVDAGVDRASGVEICHTMPAALAGGPAG
jgi:hypothetical protein